MNDENKNILNESIKRKSVEFFENNFSRISKCGSYKQIDDYIYYETNDYVFYDVYNKFFFDKNKNIIFLSNFIFQNIYYIQKNIDRILLFLENVNIHNDNIITLNEIIAIQSWAETYGHFLDEALNLYDFKDNFYKKFNKNISILMNFREPNLYNNDNYNLISNFLFKNMFLNTNKYLPNHIIKIDKLYIIKNSYGYKTFHNFPLNSTYKILSSISTIHNNIDEFNKKIFISRNGDGWNSDRLLKNKKHLEKKISEKKYEIIYPEEVDYELFIKKLQFADDVIITWGSALTNMIYLKPFTSVIILKPTTYTHEDLFLFQKIINNYKIKLIDVIDENKYNENDFLEKIIRCLE